MGSLRKKLAKGLGRPPNKIEIREAKRIRDEQRALLAADAPLDHAEAAAPALPAGAEEGLEADAEGAAGALPTASAEEGLEADAEGVAGALPTASSEEGLEADAEGAAGALSTASAEEGLHADAEGVHPRHAEGAAGARPAASGVVATEDNVLKLLKPGNSVWIYVGSDCEEEWSERQVTRLNLKSFRVQGVPTTIPVSARGLSWVFTKPTGDEDDEEDEADEATDVGQRAAHGEDTPDVVEAPEEAEIQNVCDVEQLDLVCVPTFSRASALPCHSYSALPPPAHRRPRRSSFSPFVLVVQVGTTCRTSRSASFHARTSARTCRIRPSSFRGGSSSRARQRRGAL
jgi:hypothetical protein